MGRVADLSQLPQGRNPQIARTRRALQRRKAIGFRLYPVRGKRIQDRNCDRNLFMVYRV